LRFVVGCDAVCQQDASGASAEHRPLLVVDETAQGRQQTVGVTVEQATHGRTFAARNDETVQWLDRLTSLSDALPTQFRSCAYEAHFQLHVVDLQQSRLQSLKARCMLDERALERQHTDAN